MKPTLFKIGNFELRIYSLMYILAFIIGIKIAEKDDVAKKRGIKDKKMIEDFAFFCYDIRTYRCKSILCNNEI